MYPRFTLSLLVTKQISKSCWSQQWSHTVVQMVTKSRGIGQVAGHGRRSTETKWDSAGCQRALQMDSAGLSPHSSEGLIHDQRQNQTQNEAPSNELMSQCHPRLRKDWIGHKIIWHVGHSHNDVMWKMQKDKSESLGNLSSIRQINRYWHLCLLRLYLVNNWCIPMCFYSKATLKFQSSIFPDILKD